MYVPCATEHYGVGIRNEIFIYVITRNLVRIYSFLVTGFSGKGRGPMTKPPFSVLPYKTVGI